MASYQLSLKVSKAWHLGHELAREIQAAVETSPNGQLQLLQRLQKLAPVVPIHIERSLKHSDSKQLDHYRAAREILIELQEHLLLARDRHYLERSLSKALAKKAIAIQRLLSVEIQSRQVTK